MSGRGCLLPCPSGRGNPAFFKGILIWCLCFYSQGKCQRRDPPCKYFHPPQHLRELLLQNGRNNLILKNMQLQLLQQQLAQGAMLPGLSAALAATASTPSVASPGAPGTHGITGAPQCPNPTSPVSSASIGPTVSDLVRVCHPITPWQLTWHLWSILIYYWLDELGTILNACFPLVLKLCQKSV